LLDNNASIITVDFMTKLSLKTLSGRTEFAVAEVLENTLAVSPLTGVPDGCA